MTEQIDMSRFIEAKSDQLNSDDLLGAPRTVTITRVKGCDGDQPIAIHFEDDNGKPFKPCKTIRRVLVAVWGRYANDYGGRSMTLYRDDTVQFGGLQVGGIRISHMSHLDKETIIVVAKSKGKKAGMKILPLVQQQRNEPAEQVDNAAKWADGYCAKVTAAPDAAAVSAFTAKQSARLEELKGKRPELAKQCNDAVDARLAAIVRDETNAAADAADDGFGDLP